MSLAVSESSGLAGVSCGVENRGGERDLGGVLGGEGGATDDSDSEGTRSVSLSVIPFQGKLTTVLFPPGAWLYLLGQILLSQLYQASSFSS